MGRIVYQCLEGLSVPADATLDVWSVLAGSGNPVRLHAFELTSDAIAADVVSVTLHRITAAGSGGSATGTEELADEKNSGLAGTVRTLDTTPGADGGKLMGWQWEQLGPLGHIWIPEMRPISKVSEGFALTWNTAKAATVSGYLCFEEL